MIATLDYGERSLQPHLSRFRPGVSRKDPAAARPCAVDAASTTEEGGSAGDDVVSVIKGSGR
jgi:hypothetical protein